MEGKARSVVELRKDKLGGAWVYRGTRVPVEALFENLLGGSTIHRFTEWAPGVEISQVKLVLQHQISTLRIESHG